MEKDSGGALPHSHHVSALLAVLIAAGALAGCAQPEPATRVVVARPAPPATHVEVQPPAPNARAVWDPGHWNWDGTQYVWISGHYIERPSVAMRWEPGHWMSANGGWVWTDGRWY